VYNDCDHLHNLQVLDNYLTAAISDSNTNAPLNDLWIGNFNRHDPMWDDPKDSHLFMDANTKAVDILINLMADYDMDLALPPGVPTHQHFVTKKTSRLDQVICSCDFLNNLVMCDAFPENPRWTTFQLSWFFISP
jgi:hypothetical protein